MTKRKSLGKAIDLQLSGDGSALRRMSRELLDETQKLVDLVQDILPHVNNVLECKHFRVRLKRIVNG